MSHLIEARSRAEPWNKRKLVGQKAPLRLKEIWAIRTRLQLANRVRELALFNLAIDSKLRSCDLIKLRLRDLIHGDRIAARAIIMQQKTQRPVQFEITEQTREALSAWIRRASLTGNDFLFPSRIHESPHLSTRQYSRIVHAWVNEIGLDAAAYGTHTLRRTKASLIYRRTNCPRAIGSKAPSATWGSRSTMRSKWPNRRRCSRVSPASDPARVADRPLPVIVQEATILRIVPIRFDERPERPTSSETGRRSVFMGALHPDVFQCMRDGLCLWHSRSGRALSGNLPRFGTRKDSHIGCASLVLHAHSRRCEIRFLRSRFRGY